MPLKPSLLERALENVAARMDRWSSEEANLTPPQYMLRMLADEIAEERQKREQELAQAAASEAEVLDDCRGNGQL